MARNKIRIHSGDEVIVIAGKDRGKVGKVVRVLPAERQVVVEGMRRVRRHRRPAGDMPGGIVDKEMPLDVSNVALWNAEDSRRIKIGFVTQEDGRKVRVDRATGAVLDKE